MIISILANSSYFLKVASNSKDSNIQYLIKYDYSSVNPYDSINAKASEIIYESSSEGITIYLEPTTIEKPW